MNTEAIKALIKKWRDECKEPETMNGALSAELDNARGDGYRKGIARCADQLSVLVELLGD